MTIDNIFNDKFERKDFKESYEFSKSLDDLNAVSYLTGIQKGLQQRLKWDLNVREYKIYNYLINKRIRYIANKRKGEGI